MIKELRTLDDRVALEVMGFRWATWRDYRYIAEPGDQRGADAVGTEPLDELYFVHVPRYSSDPEAFMELWRTVVGQTNVTVRLQAGQWQTEAYAEILVDSRVNEDGAKVLRPAREFGADIMIAFSKAVLSACEVRTER